jgi:hypothetical protein
MARKYSSISIETTISVAISSSATSISVASAANLLGDVTLGASDQFTLAIDPDTVNEEIIFVTAANTSTNVLTVTRARAGTTGISHAAGATIKHVLTGEDLTYFETETLKQVDKTDIVAKGDLFAGTANDTYGILTAGTNESRLVADSAETTGLKYVADTTNYAIAAKGNLLVGTAADTLQAVTVGSNGASLIADSTATPGVAWSATQVGKNILINGDLTINERGNTTDTLTTSAKFAADRFFARRTSGSSGAQYEYLTSTSLDAFPNAVRIQRDSANSATDTLIVGQTVESLNTRPLQGKTVTFSFWARKGADYTGASDALLVRVYTGTGTDQTGLGSSYTGTATPISQSATLTTSWQRFSFSATLATTATQLQATLQYVPVGTAGAADSFDITGFQLEVGSVATPFALAGGGQYESELSLCRRYYERWTSSSAYMRFGNGYATGATTARITIHFKTRKRVAVASSDNIFTALLDCSGETVHTLTSYTLAEAGTDQVTQTMTASGASFTTGELVELVTNNVTGAYQGWTAEIG